MSAGLSKPVKPTRMRYTNSFVMLTVGRRVLSMLSPGATSYPSIPTFHLTSSRRPPRCQFVSGRPTSTSPPSFESLAPLHLHGTFRARPRHLHNVFARSRCNKIALDLQRRHLAYSFRDLVRTVSPCQILLHSQRIVWVRHPFHPPLHIRSSPRGRS